MIKIFIMLCLTFLMIHLLSRKMTNVHNSQNEVLENLSENKNKAINLIVFNQSV